VALRGVVATISHIIESMHRLLSLLPRWVTTRVLSGGNFATHTQVTKPTAEVLTP